MSRLETTIVNYPYEMSHPFLQFPIYDLLMRYGWGMTVEPFTQERTWITIKQLGKRDNMLGRKGGREGRGGGATWYRL